MKLFRYMKDGGPESHVAGFFFVEIKSLFSVVLLHFGSGSREAFHTHAFDAVSWLLSGSLREHHIEGNRVWYRPSWRPIFTARETFHKVTSRGDSWVLSIRGPWAPHWHEYLPSEERYVTLTHGRRVVA